MKEDKKRRNYPKYGYCMFLTSAAPDVRAHLSGREVSTGLFLPVTKNGNQTGELPQTLTVSQTSKEMITFTDFKSQIIFIKTSAKRLSSPWKLDLLKLKNSCKI